MCHEKNLLHLLLTGILTLIPISFSNLSQISFFIANDSRFAMNIFEFLKEFNQHEG